MHKAGLPGRDTWASPRLSTTNSKHVGREEQVLDFLTPPVCWDVAPGLPPPLIYYKIQAPRARGPTPTRESTTKAKPAALGRSARERYLGLPPLIYYKFQARWVRRPPPSGNRRQKPRWLQKARSLISPDLRSTRERYLGLSPLIYDKFQAPRARGPPPIRRVARLLAPREVRRTGG